MGDPTGSGPEQGPFTLEEAARRLGNYRWIEMRAFEVLGGWVATVPEVEVKLFLGPLSHHHAWRARLWHETLPTLREMGAEELTQPPSAQVVAFFEALDDPGLGTDHTIERLTGAFRVLLPRLVAAYQEHLERTSPVADGPTIRSLGFVLPDSLADWRDGEILLQRRLSSGAEAGRAAEHQAALEGRIVEAGGLLPRSSTGSDIMH